MSKLKIPLLIVVLIAVLAVVKIYVVDATDKTVAAAPKTTKGVVVTGYKVQPQLLDNQLYTTGTILANEEAELRPEIAGKVIRMNIAEGAKVQKGQLLLKINDAEWQAQLKKLKVQYTLAKDREQRQKRLLDISGVSQEEYDVVLNQLHTIEAEVDNIQAMIDKTEIRAPFTGTLGLRRVSEGSYVTPTTTIVTMQQTEPLKVDFSVPEKYMDKIKKGDKISFTVQGLRDTFTAQVYAIEPKIDMATRSVQLRALVKNTGGKILPGAFARISLLLAQQDKALMIPTEALVPILKGQKVFLIKDGKAQEQIVETGIRTAAQIEVLSGLAAGDTVVVTGVMNVRQGSVLDIQSID
jgi:membrane fusion protein (multidrug efflux system)